jgi:hypothetical protein
VEKWFKFLESTLGFSVLRGFSMVFRCGRAIVDCFFGVTQRINHKKIKIINKIENNKNAVSLDTDHV